MLTMYEQFQGFAIGDEDTCPSEEFTISMKNRKNGAYSFCSWINMFWKESDFEKIRS